MVREGIRRSLEQSPDFRVSHDVATGSELLNRITPEVDCIITDADLPDRDGLILVEQLKQLHPSLPIVVCSNHNNQEVALRFLKNGATAFLPKSCSLDELSNAVRFSARGKRFLTPSLAAQLAAQVGHEEPHHELSNREFEVLRGISEGLSLKEIGARLDISPKTISTYRDRVLQKLNARTNADLIRYAIRNLE